MKQTFTIILSFVFWTYYFTQQPVGLDPLFGINGKVLLTDPTPSSINGIYAQVDNKILVCGCSDSSGKTRILVKRLNSDGSPDITFAQNGTLIERLQEQSCAMDLIVLPDNNILITGGTEGPPINWATNFFVMKLLPNGTKDVSYGNNGIFIANISLNSFHKVNGGRKIKVATDGSIFVGGSLKSIGNSPGFAIFKVLSNGQLDTQFGIGGYRNFSFSSMDNLSDIALQPDGKILITGGTWNPHYTLTMRFNANGSIDSSFATNGKFIKTFNTNDQQAVSILITTNKKILVSGYEESNGNSDIFIYRLDSTGTLDTTYGNNGFVNYDSGKSNSPSSMEELPDKTLIVNGSTVPGVNWGDIELVSFDSLGILNSNFGNNGSFVYDLNNSNEFSYCSAMQPDGKLINAGFTDTSFFVTRLFTSAYTGLKHNNKNSVQLNIFPNPTSEKINIVSSLVVMDYDLFDNKGSSVKKASSLEDSCLIVKKLPFGTYTLKLIFDNGFSQTVKLIINR